MISRFGRKEDSREHEGDHVVMREVCLASRKVAALLARKCAFVNSVPWRMSECTDPEQAKAICDQLQALPDTATPLLLEYRNDCLDDLKAASFVS